MTGGVQVQQASRSGSQLLLLVLAIVVTLSAFAQVGLARDGRLPAGMFEYGVGLAVLVGAAHVAVNRFAPRADPLLLPLAVLLNGLGLAMIYRLDLVHSPACAEAHARGEKCFPINASAANQLLWTAISVVFFVVVLVAVRDLRRLRHYQYTIGLAGLFFLLLPGLLPASISGSGGAKVWLRLGGFSIQPGEFAKLALVAFFAGYLVTKRGTLTLTGRTVWRLQLPRGRDMGPLVVAWLLSVGVLVLEKDIGQGILFFGMFIAMLYIATSRISWVLIALLLFSTGAIVAVNVPFLGHVNQRVAVWQHPDAYFDGGCDIGGHIINQQREYDQLHTTPDKFPATCLQLGGHWADSGQVKRGLFALAAGGVLGAGLGQGSPQLTPVSYADFIIDSFGEELGLTGLMAILLLYGILVQRGMKAAVDTADPFLKLFTAGIAFTFALQVFIIVASVTGIMPLTAGVTTPFLAQGGSALLANWMLVALLVRSSDTARTPAPQSMQDEGMTQIVSL